MTARPEERGIRDVCWICLGTGYVIDGVKGEDGEYRSGPDDGKPCEAGCPAPTAEAPE